MSPPTVCEVEVCELSATSAALTQEKVTEMSQVTVSEYEIHSQVTQKSEQTISVQVQESESMLEGNYVKISKTIQSEIVTDKSDSVSVDGPLQDSIDARMEQGRCLKFIYFKIELGKICISKCV